MFSLRILRIKAMQHLFASLTHQKVEGAEKGVISLSPRGIQQVRDSLERNVEVLHHLHSSFLQLMVAWAEIEKRQAERLIEATPTPLYDDMLLTQVRLHPSFAEVVARYPMTFPIDKVERWYYAYLSHPKASSKREKWGQEGGKTLVMEDLLKYMFHEKEIQTRASHQDMGWCEDQAIVFQRLRRFIKDFAQAPEGSWDVYEASLEADKADFYVDLVTKTWASLDEHAALLAKKVDNWALERINMLDRTLISMALTEIKRFPHIPTKVSINEYLEIAKRYSTPKSASFINGVVDSIAKELDVKNA